MIDQNPCGALGGDRLAPADAHSGEAYAASTLASEPWVASKRFAVARSRRRRFMPSRLLTDRNSRFDRQSDGFERRQIDVEPIFPFARIARNAYVMVE